MRPLTVLMLLWPPDTGRRWMNMEGLTPAQHHPPPSTPPLQTQDPQTSNGQLQQAGFYVANSAANRIEVEQLLVASLGGNPAEALDRSTL